MAKSTLKLGTTWNGWGAGVRQGRLVRSDGHEAAVLVRTSDEEASTERVAARRAEIKLVGRVVHPAFLRVDQVAAIGGRVAYVVDGFDGANLPRIVQTLRTRGQGIPVRALTELAGILGEALQALVDVEEGGRALAAPPQLAHDVLVDARGSVRLAGWAVTPGGPGDARASAAATALAWLVAELLGAERPVQGAVGAEAALAHVAAAGGTPGLVRALGEVLLVGGGADAGPGALARSLAVVAAEQSGPTLVAWAPAMISTALRDAAGPALLPEDTGVRQQPRASSGPILGSGGTSPLPEASRPFVRSELQAQRPPVPRPAPPAPRRKAANLDLFMGDDADVEATVVGILREPVGRAPAPDFSDPFDLTSQVPLPSGPAEPSRWNSLEAPVAPPPEPARNGASPAFIGFMGALGLVLLLAAGWFFFAGGGGAASDAAPAEIPAAAADAPTGTSAVPVPDGSGAPVALPPSPPAAREGVPAMDARPGSAPRTSAPARSEPARAAPPATQAAPAAVPVSGAPEFYNVEFRNASSTVTGLAVACKDNVGGKGSTSVSLVSVPRGPCAVTGSTGGGVPLRANVTVTASQAYTCFANDSRVCQ